MTSVEQSRMAIQVSCCEWCSIDEIITVINEVIARLCHKTSSLFTRSKSHKDMFNTLESVAKSVSHSVNASLRP